MMSLSAFNRIYIDSHYAIDNNATYPGFYIGDATSFEDLVTFWNLKATDIPLVFYDPAHAERLDQWKNDWLGRLSEFENPRRPHERPALWHREERSEEHTSELQSLMLISSSVFCLKKKI